MADTNIPVQCAPSVPVPIRVQVPDARQTLHRLADELMRTHNRKMLIEFLQLRRALR